MIRRNPLAEGFDVKTSRYYTLDNGEIVTPAWAEKEVAKRLNRFRYTLSERKAMASKVISRPRHNAQTITSLMYLAWATTLGNDGGI